MYNRTAREKAADFQNSRKFEEEVASHLPEEGTKKFLTADKPDFVIDFNDMKLIVEVKEKNQHYRKDIWPLGETVDENDQFIIDERTIRKLNMESPYLWFVLHDKLNDRLFLAPHWELTCSRRKTLDRPQSNVQKGKWVIVLTDFRQIKLKDLWKTVQQDIEDKPWTQSNCVNPTSALLKKVKR